MDDPAHDIEFFKAQLQTEIERYKAIIQSQQNLWLETETRNRHAWLSDREDRRILAKAVLDFAGITIRSLIFVNGGAAIGILTFLGNLWNKDPKIARASAMAIAPGLGWFIAGLALALLTSGLAYLTQVAFSELSSDGEKSPATTWGNMGRVVTITLAVFSLASFIFGAWKCMAVFIAPPFLS